LHSVTIRPGIVYENKLCAADSSNLFQCETLFIHPANPCENQAAISTIQKVAHDCEFADINRGKEMGFFDFQFKSGLGVNFRIPSLVESEEQNHANHSQSCGD
jgi:hypothetical protein